MAKKPQQDVWLSHRSARKIRRKRAGIGNLGNGESSNGLSGWWKLLIALGAVAVVCVAAAAASAMLVYNTYADDLVPPDQLAINEPSYGAKILDRNGTLLYEYVDDKSGLRRPVALEEVSEAFLAATIATEDDSFFSNPGVNFRGLARAGAENIGLGDGDAFSGSGGSSITQQLVKNVYISEEERQERWSQQGINRKLKETVYAMELTERYAKEQILEWYVNQISYGGVYNGIEAAALGYLGKSAKDLTLAEAAMIAGIPQSPSDYDPVNNPEGALQRRNQILDLMLHQGPIRIGEDKWVTVTPEEVLAAQQEPLQISDRRFPIEAPHFVLQYVQPQLEALWGHDDLLKAGLVVTTSLDLNLQYKTAEIMERYIQQNERASNSHDGSMMIIDPKTGELLVMLGSRDYWNDVLEGKNNNATSCNSPGSAFKPFAYITTFLESGWAPGTMILDTPVSFSQGPGQPAFVPRNPAGNFQGPVTIRNSLGSSLNIPANKAAEAVGPNKVAAQGQKMGFADSFKVGAGGCAASDFYGPAVATGGVGVTLEEMMVGYSVLANGGVMRGMPAPNPADAQQRAIDPVTILNVTDAKGETRFDITKNRKEQRVVEDEYTYLVWDILSDPQAQCLTFQCGGITIPGYKAAVKTGTSEPYPAGHRCAGKIGETWTFAYSPDLVVGIWAGNSNNDCITDIVSTSIAFRSARDVFSMAHQGRPVTAMPRPPEIVEAEVCVPSGLRPTELCALKARDIFVRGRVPNQDDTWWQKVAFDKRSNQPAAPGTPQEFLQEGVALVLPPDWFDTPEESRIVQQWAASLRIPLAQAGNTMAFNPTQNNNNNPTPPAAPTQGNNTAAAVISAPNSGDTVSGVIQVRGRATSPDFESFRLEFGVGASPTSWQTLRTSQDDVQNGTLATVDTRQLPNGEYALRVVVVDRRQGEIASAPVVIRVAR
jgi:membrane peptidoglycan carboxypeptidase